MCIALVAAGYVWRRELLEGEKTPHEKITKCIIILTSVVPRGLPMQMSLAVKAALMSHHSSGVISTEFFCVLVAGKVTHCLFDKTGTLTTEELVPAGVVNLADSWSKGKVRDASVESSLVRRKVKNRSYCRGRYGRETLPNGSDPCQIRPDSAPVPFRFEASTDERNCRCRSKRGHRRSCAERQMRPGEGISRGCRGALLCRGTKNSLPRARVFALALRQLDADGDVSKLSREEVERDLRFVGFFAFECQIRADSALVIDALKTAGHAVAMGTGDAPLTALHVANNTCLADPTRPSVLLRCRGDEGPCWTVGTSDRRGKPAPPGTTAELAQSINLAVTEERLGGSRSHAPQFFPLFFVE